MKRFFAYVLLCSVVAGVGCSNQLDPANGDGNGNGNDTNDPNDTDRDTDDDSDNDTDPDTQDPNKVDCNADYTVNMTAPRPDQCVTETITCGQTIFATTEGGNDFYDFFDYEALQAIGRWSSTVADYTGPERGFEYSLAANQQATFTFESPCDDIKVTKINNPNLETCPAMGGPTDSKPRTSDNTAEFDMKDIAIRNPLDSILIVESPEGVATNFKVTMECTGG